MRRLFQRAQMRWLMIATGGGLFVLEGCDTTVRDTILAGVEGAATTLLSTFISAFFQTLQPAEEEAATTVKAIIEQLPQYFA